MDSKSDACGEPLYENPRPVTDGKSTAGTEDQEGKTLSVDAALLDALARPDHPYHHLAQALAGAYAQAALGKGKDRHANDLPFHRQRMQTIAQGQGSTQGMTYQVCKKAQESERMAPEAKIRELQGAIVYAAGAIVFEEARHES